MVGIRISPNSQDTLVRLTAGLADLQGPQVRPYVAEPVYKDNVLYLEGTLNSAFGIWNTAAFGVIQTSVYTRDAGAVDSAYDAFGTGVSVVWSLPTPFGYTILLFAEQAISSNTILLVEEFVNPPDFPLTGISITTGNQFGSIGPLVGANFWVNFPYAAGYRSTNFDLFVSVGQVTPLVPITGIFEIRFYNSFMVGYNGFEFSAPFSLSATDEQNSWRTTISLPPPPGNNDLLYVASMSLDAINTDVDPVLLAIQPKRPKLGTRLITA